MSVADAKIFDPILYKARQIENPFEQAFFHSCTTPLFATL